MCHHVTMCVKCVKYVITHHVTMCVRLRAERSEFPGGVCKIKCKADIAGGVWATSQSQVSNRLLRGCFS